MSTQINSFDLAPILIQTGYGIPDHISPLGSEYTDLYTAFKYYNSNGLTNWVQYIDSSFSGGTGGGGIFSGGTVTGPTYFLNGVTANTISATTYLGLPTDVTITGGTYSTGTTVFTNNTGGTYNVSGYTYIPHLGYDNLNSTIWNYGFGGNVNNISFGENSLISNTIGEYNTAFGSGVLTGNTIGNDNTGIGNYALNSNITGDYNTGIGSSALQYNTYGVQNFAIGAYSLYSNTTGSYNTGIGVSALENNIVGERNISIGGFSLYQNIGSRNTAIGFFAGSATLGDDNILFGSNSNNITDGLVSGSNNTIIGTSVSGIINGSNNTIFGKPTGLSSTTSNNIVIADGSGNIRFRDNNVNTILPRLAGSGNRMVIVGPNGELSAITITNTTFTGGTVNGPTIFTGGLTATTISATTYQNLPTGYYLAISDSTTQDNPTANIPRAVKFNTTDLANGFSLQTQTAIFTGTINNGGVGAGTILNVTAVTSGTLKVGMVLTGGSITAGTFISAFTSGTGGTGTYVVSVSQLKTSATYTGTMTSQIVVANTGIYNLQFSSQMDKSDAGVDYVNFWLRKNGADVTASSGVISLQGNSPAYMMAAWNYLIELVAGDIIELYWGSADINMSIINETAQTSPFVHPAVQSTILTITQQSGIMGGVSTTLQQAYNNSTNPEILINSTLDGLSIKNGTGNADNVTKLIEGLNAAGNTTSFIRADGDISGTTLQTNSFVSNSTGVTQSSGFTILSNLSTLNAANDAGAAGLGVPLYGLYRNGNVVQIRLV